MLTRNEIIEEIRNTRSTPRVRALVAALEADIRAERDTYRKALDAILRVDDEAESFGLAHDAITPYTQWRRATAEEEAAVDAAVKSGHC